MVVELSRSTSAFADVLESAEREDGERGSYIADTVHEHAALSLAVLDQIATSPSRDVDQEELIRSLAIAITNRAWSHEEALEAIRDVALDGLYEWIDEKIDSRNAVLGLLMKYKQRSEWFGRERLRVLAEAGGERALAVDLQQYIFDQGVEFTIEPTSSSGEPDLVLRDTDDSHVILDAKYISLGTAAAEFKRKLSYGFHQVAHYCQDFNEPLGYLVVFLADRKSPALPLTVQDGFSFLEVNGKLVYYVPVAIADAPSASKAGRAEEVAISMADLITSHVADVSADAR